MNVRRIQSGSAEVHTVRAQSPAGGTDREIELRYAETRVIGNGSFGVVYRATLFPNNEEVAIKKVLQDKRYKNRELQIMRRLDHRNVVKLKYFFYSNGDKGKDDVYLNLVLEYVPDTVYRVARHYTKQRQIIPILYIKLYMYQLFRALGYIHGVGICHRDIKPQNLLLNVSTSVLKLCDFGSAKNLVHGEPNVAYICSRYYRAPELIFGATNYTTKIDMWSAGTVLAELLMGQPFFPGDSGVDQLVEIIKVLGTPSREEILQMNPNYQEFRFPTIRPQSWSRVFRSRTPQNALDLISHILKYNPGTRFNAQQAMAHEFFEELRMPNAKLPSNAQLPPLFDFSGVELNIEPTLLERLMPNSQTTTDISTDSSSQTASRKSSTTDVNGSQGTSTPNVKNGSVRSKSPTSIVNPNKNSNYQQQQTSTVMTTAQHKKSTESSSIGSGSGNGTSSTNQHQATSSALHG